MGDGGRKEVGDEIGRYERCSENVGSGIVRNVLQSLEMASAAVMGRLSGGEGVIDGWSFC